MNYNRFNRNRSVALLGGVMATLSLASLALASEYHTRVVATGLDQPTGIVAAGPRTLIITQVPTPGIPGSEGGLNTVDLIRLRPNTDQNRMWNLSAGEPEPTNLALDRYWNLYWTCKSAGVILQRSPTGDVSRFLDGLDQPTGIAVDRWNNVYFTLLPTPGVFGDDGGMNTVNVSDGETIEVLSLGEPGPTDVAVGRDGTAYWTCQTAGVILKLTPEGEKSFVLTDLDAPTGIALDHKNEKLYFTELPTPGVPGSMGGENKVSVYDLKTEMLELVDAGDPEPTDIAVAENGAVFWTCTTAGVIVEAREKRHGH